MASLIRNASTLASKRDLNVRFWFGQRLNGKNEEIDKLAGQKVKIVSDLAGDTLRVVTIESAR